MYNITLCKAVNGVIVHVGCKTFVSVDLGMVLGEVARYFESDKPRTIEKEYFDKYFPNEGMPPEPQIPLSEVATEPTGGTGVDHAS